VIGLRLRLLLVALALFAVVASRFELRTDITYFMPAGNARAASAIARELTDSQLTRTMVLSIEAPKLATALAASEELEAQLQENPQVAWVRGSIEADQARRLFGLYFPHRYNFLSDAPEDPERGVAAQLSNAALRQRARTLRRQLAQPAGSFLEQLAARDPLGAFAKLLQRVRGTEQGISLEHGRFVSRDRDAAILLLATHASAFDTSAQAPFLKALDAAFAAIAARRGPGLVLESSGVNRFAVHIEDGIQSDVWHIMLLSTVGVALLFLAFFRSATVFGLAALPAVYGILGAAAAGTLLFGRLDALTLGFAASLIGVAIDYPIHLMNHYGLAPEGGPERAARRLRVSLLLGAGTTMASFAGLALTSFPGFRQMGFVAITGVAVAVFFTLRVLPRLLSHRVVVPPRSRRVAAALGRAMSGLDRHRAALLVVPVLTALFGALAIPQLHWSDDIQGLSQLDSKLMAEDLRVRARVSRFDASRFVLVTGGDEAEALERNDAVYARLRAAEADGTLDGMRSLHALLWSPRLQRQNLAALRGQKDLPTRLERAFVAEGFRPGAFRGFEAGLLAAPSEPLDLSDLQGSGLADLVRSLVVKEPDGGLGIVTYLRGVHSEPALREAIAGIPGAQLFDQRSFLNELYAGFRVTTLRQIGVGSLLVIAVLLLRYRRLRPALAAFLPSLLTASLVLSLLACFGVKANLLHAVSLVMVMGMGVDYGIFVVDTAHDPRALGATLLSLLLSCLTTVFVFGTLALSSHPALRAMGVTTSLGIALSLVLAPVTLAWLGPPAHKGDDGGDSA